MLDRYFKHPVFWDYVISFFITVTVSYFLKMGYFKIPSTEHLYSTASDMSTISLTMAGFILTLLTVLISFKSTNKIDKQNIQENDKIFDIFFVSKLYFQTVVILKNAIKSLTLIALIGYLLKLTLNSDTLLIMYFYCIFSISILLFTLWRSILILGRIVKMQELD